MSDPLPEEIKKRITAIAEAKDLKVQDPGTVWRSKEGAVWVFCVDKATDIPVWLLLPDPS
jgi:hypothetical protein